MERTKTDWRKMIKDSFLLAIGKLRHRKLRSWLTILGIFIGIAAVVSLMSLGDGLRTAINAQFGSLSTDTLIVQNKGTGFGPPGSTAIRKLTEHDIKVIEQVNGIDSVVTRLIRIAKIEYNKIIKFNYLASVPEDKDKREVVYNQLPELEEGKLLTEQDKGKIVLGSDFSGEQFEKKIKIGSKILIQGKEFEVLGILKKSSTFTINSAILMLEDDMKKLLSIEDEIDLIVVQAHQENIEEIAKEIERKFRQDRKEKVGEETFDVQTPLQAIQSAGTILNIVNLIVTGIAAISLLIGGLGIANTMYTSVLERTREIGTMKAIGAKNSDILSLFLIESGLLGAIGGIVGAGAGLGLAYLASKGANSAFGETLFSVSFNPSLFFGAIAFSFIVGILSGVLPAYQASKLNPVEALRR